MASLFLCKHLNVHMTRTFAAACRFEDKLVGEIQKYYLTMLRALTRPPVEHDVEQPGLVDDIRSQLLKCKVCVFLLRLQRMRQNTNARGTSLCLAGRACSSDTCLQ